MKKIITTVIAMLMVVSFVSAIELLDPVAIHNIGYYSYQEGHLNLAEALFTKAISLDDSYEKAYASRALVRFELENYEGAIQDFEKLVEFDSLNAQYWYDLGINYIANFRYGTNDINDFCKGMGAYENVLLINNNYAHVNENLNVLYEIRDNFGLTC